MSPLWVVVLLSSMVESDPLESLFSSNLSVPYVVKKTWVDNFVRFNYVLEAKSSRPRIVAVGCVPTNNEKGKLLPIGDSAKEHEFVFVCQQDGHGVVSYEAVGCVDPLGNEMKIGEARKLSNGTVIMHCGIYGGLVKKVIEKAAGCVYNNTLYGEDDTWVEPLETPNSPVTIEKFAKRNRIGRRDALTEVHMRGRLMQCFRPHYNFFEIQLIGCVVGKFGIRIDEYAQVQPEVYVKCVEKEGGGVHIKSIQAHELSCQFFNTTMPEGYVWADEDRAAEFTCNAGNVVKKACVLGKERVPLGKEVRVLNGCVFVCHPGANVYMCDKVLPSSGVVDEDREPDGVSYVERQEPPPYKDAHPQLNEGEKALIMELAEKYRNVELMPLPSNQNGPIVL